MRSGFVQGMMGGFSAVVWTVTGAWAGGVGSEPLTGKDLCKSLTNGQKQVQAEAVGGVDGDTVKVVIDGQRISIRMLGIDTPETHYEGKTQGVWGERAADELKSLVRSGDDLQIELGPEACDSYGRILGFIWKGKQDLNRHQVERGLAVNFCIAPTYNHCEEYGELVTENVARKVGMFSDPSVQVPYVWRAEVSGKKPTRLVGSMKTKKVYAADELARVPVGDRIFFSNRSAIQPPYQWVDSKGGSVRSRSR
jgi:micrococcal nuclease